MFWLKHLTVFKFFQFSEKEEFEKLNIIKVLESNEGLLSRISADPRVRCYVNGKDLPITFDKVRRKFGIFEIFLSGSNHLQVMFIKSESRKDEKNLTTLMVAVDEKESPPLDLKNIIEKEFFCQWGYICRLRSDYDTYSETWVNWVTGSSGGGYRRRLDLEKFNSGYVPRLYGKNYLNRLQVEKLAGYIPRESITQIRDNLFFAGLEKQVLREINKKAKSEKFEYLIHPY